MCSVWYLTIQFVVIAHAHSNRRVAHRATNVQDYLDQSADDLVNSLVDKLQDKKQLLDRAFKKWENSNMKMSTLLKRTKRSTIKRRNRRIGGTPQKRKLIKLKREVKWTIGQPTDPNSAWSDTEGLAAKIKKMEVKQIKRKQDNWINALNMTSDFLGLNISDYNVLQRELMFHAQAEDSVKKVISRLLSMGVPAFRPDGYFTEMLKDGMRIRPCVNRVDKVTRFEGISGRLKRNPFKPVPTVMPEGEGQTKTKNRVGALGAFGL